ncbi:MAG: PH domain-containing protein [Planctomycetota bacterium]|nr:MAG: PH domain-containing protein [Planctomycetota bacterium]REK22223.1 MAG: PH domain-containing protein [Planctomycetota bacterium]REK44297.1 MAG: PH domain-containing protein [Planctomycetota bacterium]
MRQAIAGVAPPQLAEVTVMTVWPSLAASGIGRWWGRLYSIDVGIRVLGIPVTIGRLIALASIPFILPPFFLSLVPGLARRYRLTNRRVLIEKQQFSGKYMVEAYVPLEKFDSIEIVELPGQAWYKAGDLVFFEGNTETFRLPGIARPQTFRHTCLKASQSHAGVAAAMAGA